MRVSTALAARRWRCREAMGMMARCTYYHTFESGKLSSLSETSVSFQIILLTEAEE
jgi:hypothetical protein